VLGDYSRRFPDIELIVLAGITEFLLDSLRSQHLDLASLRFILYEKHTAMQNVIDRYFASLGVTPHITMEAENNEAIKSLVRAGLGASIMPLCAVAQEPPGSPLCVLRVRRKVAIFCILFRRRRPRLSG
jgi:DNA-binding transcriptional LysR family regulator